MKPLIHRTKIVATIGPASSSPKVIKQLMLAGMNVARLNFSHGSYEDHAALIKKLRSIADELELPLTLLQDLQGPKIRVGELPDAGITLHQGDDIILVPLEEYTQQAKTIGIDYPHVAEEAKKGDLVLLDDGLLELKVETVEGHAVRCSVVTVGCSKVIRESTSRH